MTTSYAYMKFDINSNFLYGNRFDAKLAALWSHPLVSSSIDDDLVESLDREDDNIT